MKTARSHVVVALLLVTACCILGCNSGETLGPVSGNVTFQGKPVTEGTVLFRNKEMGVYMTANLDSQGHYEVKQPKGNGLPPGDYQVSVNPPLFDAPMAGSKQPVKIPTFPNIPRKYHDPDQSGLTLTVPEEGTTLNIEMTP